MDTLFYKKNFRIIREKLEPELKRLMASRENYAKLVGYLVVAEDQLSCGCRRSDGRGTGSWHKERGDGFSL